MFTRSTWKTAVFDLPDVNTDIKACIRPTDVIIIADSGFAALSGCITLGSKIVPEFVEWVHLGISDISERRY